jgi:hypothetical protein
VKAHRWAALADTKLALPNTGFRVEEVASKVCGLGPLSTLK